MTSELEEVRAAASGLRADVIRMIESVKVGYLLQGLGAADIFAALYFAEMRGRPQEPTWPDRDRLLLSTAHNTAIFYAALARRGYFPIEELATYGRDGSALEVNASERLGPMIEATCGSLGQGLSVGVGMALSLRRRGSPARVYVILGDGELQEGQVWEAALAAANLGLDNLCLVIDRNYLQVEGHTDQVARMDPIVAKFQAFGWAGRDVDGNDAGALLEGFASARAQKAMPFVLNAMTLPGAGVPFLEGRMNHVARLTSDEAQAALSHLLGDAQWKA